MMSFRHLAVVVLSIATVVSFGVHAAEEAAFTPPGSAAHLLIDVSGTIFKATLTQPKDDISCIEDRILDAHVFGTAWTKSCVDLELVPDACSASIDVVLRGTTKTKSVGYQEPAKIYTFSEMPFILRKRIGIGDRGVYGYVPAVQVKAMTDLLKITDFRDEEFAFADAARRLFYETRPEATYWVECKARQRLITRFESEILPQLKKADKGYQAALQWVNSRLGKTQDKLRFSSTATTATVALELQSSPGDKVLAPPPLPAFSDLAFRLHESTVREVGQRMLAGKTYALDDLGSLAESFLESLPGKSESKPKDETETSASDDSIAITFARNSPVTAAFADQAIKIVVQGDNYKMGKDDYQGFRVTAAYKLETEKGKIAAVRQGPLVVEPVGEPTGKQKKLPRAELAFLRQAFENVFVERVFLPEVSAPAPWTRLGTLLPRTAQARNGWLLLAWQHKS